MKKHLIIFLAAVVIAGFVPVNSARAEELSSKLKGRILLQIESKGEAWYVNPKDSKRYYMANGPEAYKIMRDLGVGVTNKNLEKIKSDKIFAKKQQGKIFLQIESHGEAYYIDTKGEAHYLKDGEAAYGIMRELGLGIKTADLIKISLPGEDKAAADKIITNKATSNTATLADLKKKIPHLTVLKTKAPKSMHSWAVTEKISAAQGGELSLLDPQGVLVKLVIPAGSLSQDTEITLSPLNEVPIENYTSKFGNGVLIEPEGLKFSKNAVLTFDFKPAEASGGFTAGQPKPINSLSKTAGVIHVDSLKGRVNNARASLSQYGSKLSVSLSSLSSFVPDDLSGDNGQAVAESELPADAADLGICSQQFLNAALKIIQYAQFTGDKGVAEGVTGVIEECGKRAVDEMEARCNENPMQVRRRDIVNVMQLVQQIGPTDQAIRADKLMTDCRREYSISASQTAIIEQGTSIYSIDAKLCGYIDEEWQGNEVADYTLLVTHQRYAGAIKFTLPWDAAEFDMKTSGELVAQSPFLADITVPYTGQGQLAYYGGQRKIIVHYQGWGNFEVEAPITVKAGYCETTNQEIRESTGW